MYFIANPQAPILIVCPFSAQMSVAMIDYINNANSMILLMENKSYSSCEHPPTKCCRDNVENRGNCLII